MNTSSNLIGPAAWQSRWLTAAGVYNLLWGTLIILWPGLLFDMCGIARPNYVEIWQCVGMIVGVYGIGYLIAATDPRRHWPIVLVGLLGKIFGPAGFAVALSQGVFPPLFGITILTNDLIWWIPFALMLRDAGVGDGAEDDDLKPGDIRFVWESRLAAPPETVFHFHESPSALTELIPPWEPMRVVARSGSLAPGSRVVLQGSIGPWPVRWVAVHEEYHPPHLFSDRQESGPFAAWNHRHFFFPDGRGGTILRDEVVYTPPLGWLGRYLGGWLIHSKMERMFEYRHRRTRSIVETPRRGTDGPGDGTAG